MDDDRRHVRRAALLGAGAGAASTGIPAYILLRRMGVGRREAAALGAFGGAKGAVVGTGLGLTAGLITKPKKQVEYEDPYDQFEAKLDRIISFGEDPRPRNRLGMFTTGEEGGPDPNAMFKTYQQPQPPRSNLLATAEGTAIGTASTLGTKAIIDKLRKVKVK